MLIKNTSSAAASVLLPLILAACFNCYLSTRSAIAEAAPVPANGAQAPAGEADGQPRKRTATVEQKVLKRKLLDLAEKATSTPVDQDQAAVQFKQQLQDALKALSAKKLPAERLKEALGIDEDLIEHDKAQNGQPANQQEEPKGDEPNEDEETKRKVRELLGGRLEILGDLLYFKPEILHTLAKIDDSEMTPLENEFKRMILCYWNEKFCLQNPTSEPENQNGAAPLAGVADEHQEEQEDDDDDYDDDDDSPASQEAPVAYSYAGFFPQHQEPNYRQRKTKYGQFFEHEHTHSGQNNHPTVRPNYSSMAFASASGIQPVASIAGIKPMRPAKDKSHSAPGPQLAAMATSQPGQTMASAAGSLPAQVTGLFNGPQDKFRRFQPPKFSPPFMGNLMRAS